MSMHAVSWALAQRGPTSSSKHILVAIAEAASPGDWLASVTTQQLSEATSQDPHTVSTALDQLAAAGLIVQAGGHSETRVWRLPINERSEADAKRFLTLRASAALVGFELLRTDARDGAVRYLGIRWGSTKDLGTDLNVVERFVRVMGGVS